MFGIGLQELIFIFIVGLIVIGPEKLPEVARQVAKFFFHLKKTADEFKNELNKDLGEDLKEIKEIKELKENITVNPISEIEDRLKDIYDPPKTDEIPSMEGWKSISKKEKDS